MYDSAALFLWASVSDILLGTFFAVDATHKNGACDEVKIIFSGIPLFPSDMIYQDFLHSSLTDFGDISGCIGYTIWLVICLFHRCYLSCFLNL